MRKLVIASFSHPADARQALRRSGALTPTPTRGRARLHREDLDPMLAVDLSGTRAQGRRELSVGLRFGLAFGLCAAAGLALDLAGTFGDLPFVGLMIAGSVGVAVGTLAVVLAATDPLDAALDSANAELRQGRTLLTVPVEDGEATGVHAIVASHSGRTLFDA